MSFPPRSPRHLTGGIVMFARVLDKIRLHESGGLPANYNLGVMPSNRTFDDRLCKFLGVDFDALSARTLEGGSDDEVLDWCFAQGGRPSDEQIEIFNAFLTKRGWRDSGSAGLIKSRAEAGLAEREDLVTYFDVIDVEEGWSK